MENSLKPAYPAIHQTLDSTRRIRHTPNAGIHERGTLPREEAVFAQQLPLADFPAPAFGDLAAAFIIGARF